MDLGEGIKRGWGLRTLPRELRWGYLALFEVGVFRLLCGKLIKRGGIGRENLHVLSGAVVKNFGNKTASTIAQPHVLFKKG